MNEGKIKKCIKCKSVLVGNKKRILCSNCKSELVHGTMATTAIVAFLALRIPKICKSTKNKQP